MAYRFITNFNKDRLINTKIALTAVGIIDYKFCTTAKNAFGEIMPEYYALYFGETVSPREVELYYQAIAITEEKLAQKDNKE